MPLYEFSCPRCQVKFELLRPMSRAGEDATCPTCNEPGERVLSSFAVFAKGADGLTRSLNPSVCTSCSATSCATCPV